MQWLVDRVYLVMLWRSRSSNSSSSELSTLGFKQGKQNFLNETTGKNEGWLYSSAANFCLDEQMLHFKSSYTGGLYHLQQWLHTILVHGNVNNYVEQLLILWLDSPTEVGIHGWWKHYVVINEAIIGKYEYASVSVMGIQCHGNIILLL